MWLTGRLASHASTAAVGWIHMPGSSPGMGVSAPASYAPDSAAGWRFLTPMCAESNPQRSKLGDRALDLPLFQRILDSEGLSQIEEQVSCAEPPQKVY